MEWTTHALSGIVAGYSITGGDWRGGIVGGVAGVISDLDEPKSKFGRMFFPISYPLNSMFGHRTFTHSLLFAILLSVIILPFTKLWVSLSVFAGIIAHIVGDMLTGTVLLFYPLRQPIGIRIPPITFTLIDRLTRVALLAVLGFIVWQEIQI